MGPEMEAYWEAKQRIERKLLIGAGALLLLLGSAACAEGPTAPYTQLEPQQGNVVSAEEPRENQTSSRCGDLDVSEKVCEKALGDAEL